MDILPVASSSRQLADTYWDPPQPVMSFPTSTCRSHDYTNSATSSHSLATYSRTPNYLASTSYPIELPPRRQIQQGVWLYGSDTVYTADLPELQAFLAEAQATLTLPQNLPEHLVALAALEVFYFPGNPVHWLFWNDERKRETAELVSRICLKQPPVIHCKRTNWNGAPEYLNLLSSIHGSGYRHLFEHEGWYQVVVPPKLRSPARIPNLRKRKPAQLTALCQTYESHAEEESEESQEPPRKRPRPKRSGNGRKVSKDAQPTQEHNTAVPEDVLPQEAPSSAGADPSDNARTIAPANLLGDVSDSREEQRTTDKRRQQKRSRQLATTPSLISSTTSDPSSSESATLPLASLSRIRSTSQSSAETLVGCRARSMSRLSSDTVVQESVSKKGKMKEEDICARMITRSRGMRAISVDSTLKESDESNAQCGTDKEPEPVKSKSKSRASSAKKRPTKKCMGKI